MVRNLFLLIAATLFTFHAHSQQSIEDARRTGLGETVTVSGIVTNGDELGLIRYFQDGTAGLSAYDQQTATLQRGDSVTISGTLKEFRNLLEIDPVTSFTVHSSGNQLPAPKIISANQIGEEYEGQLVQINDVEFVNPTGSFEGDANYKLTDGENTFEIRINRNTEAIVGEQIPTGKLNVVAICTQFSYNQNDITTGYQLLPRNMDDFILTSAINIISPVTIGNITKSGFSLSWRTDTDATPEVIYGTTPNSNDWRDISTGTKTESDGEFIHTVTIAGREAGSVIYAQPYSYTSADTAFAPLATYATKSNSTGDIKAYFNTEVDHTVSTSSLAKNIGTAMNDTLIAYIDRATESIDLAIYNINNSGLSNVSEALNAAHDRGVRIRFITCESTQHQGTEELKSEIPVLERPEIQDGGIMHNKFAVIDAQSADASKPVVWSGSTNLTYGQIREDANNMIFIQDQSLAKAYQIEFEEMWGSTGNTPGAANAKFGADKADNTPHEFIIGGNRVELYFSPSDGTNQQLIDAIEMADDNLNVATMLITRTDLAVAISDEKTDGVAVNVLTDYEGSNSEIVNDILLDELGPGNYIFDDEAAYILHHKYAVIDNSQPDLDPLVITGSHNWSNSANIRNDENTLIIHNGDIANQYYQNFVARFKANNGNLATLLAEWKQQNLKVYPNPATDILNISGNEPFTRIEIYSITGSKEIDRTIHNSTATEIRINKLQPGLHFLKISLKNSEPQIFKFLKK